jgi:hypothetical protein
VRTFCWIGVCLTLLLAESATAQSPRLIELHVSMDSPRSAIDVTIMEGQRFRLTVDDRTYEILPVVDAARGMLRLTIFGAVAPGGREFRELETLSATVGVSVQPRSLPNVRIVVEGLRREVER